jgi:polyisoprenoid-binding protein YceI
MRKNLFLGILFLSLLLVSRSAITSDFSISEMYPIDMGHSYIGFSIKYMGFAKVRGRFTDFSGTLRYVESDITKSSATVIIKSESIITDHEMRDKDLKSSNWFDVEKYPSIKFQTKRVIKNGNRVEAIGDLTIKDITKEVRLRMDYCSGLQKDVRADHQVVFTGGTTINRKDYGIAGEKWSRIKEGITAVDSEVEIELSILGKQIQVSNLRNWVNDPETPSGKIYKMLTEADLESGIQEFVNLMLMKEGRVEDAIRIFDENARVFPQDAKTYDLLAAAYAVKGELPNAVKYYKLALEKDPADANAIECLRQLSD